MIYIYNFLLTLALVAAVPYFSYRLLMGKDEFSALKEKLGSYRIPQQKKGGIWIHAVSVGETNTAIPVVDSLLAKNPEQTIIFSTSTATGMALARKRLEGKVSLVHFPYDFSFAIKSALSHFSPSLLVFMETEIWPNFLHRANKLGIPTILINGRISDRSFSRYKIARFFFAPFISLFGRLLMQSDEDAKRITALGGVSKSVTVTGNLKFDKPAPENENKRDLREFFNIPQERPAIIFASIHPGEDEIVLQAIKELRKKFKDLFAVIAPRHIQRAKDIAVLCRRNGFEPKLRSQGSGEAESILILDTIGELARIYGAVNCAVIGGSFVEHGGQNPLEAALWKIPVLFGPHMENFRDIAQKLTATSGATASCGAIMVENQTELIKKLSQLLKDPAERGNMGRAGYETVIKNRGALEKTVNAINELYDHAGDG